VIAELSESQKTYAIVAECLGFNGSNQDDLFPGYNVMRQVVCQFLQFVKNGFSDPKKKAKRSGLIEKRCHE